MLTHEGDSFTHRNARSTNDVINENFIAKFVFDTNSPSATSSTMTDKLSVNDQVYCVRGSYKGHYAEVVKVMRMKVTIRLLANGKQPNVFKTSLRRIDKVHPKTFVRGLLHHYPDLAEQVDDVCYQLARCSVEPKSQELVEYLQGRIHHFEKEMKFAEKMRLPKHLKRLQQEEESFHYVSGDSEEES